MQFTRNKHIPVIVADASKEEIALNNNNINRTCLCCNESKNLDKFFQNEELRTNREVVCMSCCSKLLVDVDNFNLSDFKYLHDKIINNDYEIMTGEYVDDVKTTRDLVTNIYKDLIKPKKPSKSEVKEGEMYYENSRWYSINKEPFTKSIEKGTELTNIVSKFNDLSINSKLIEGELYFSVRDSYEMLEVNKITFLDALNNILGDKIFELFGNPEQLKSTLIYKIHIKASDNKYYQVEHISLSLLNEVVFRTHSRNSSKIKEFISELITNYQVKGYVLDEKKLIEDNNYKLLGEVRTKSLELSNLPRKLISKVDDLASKTRMNNLLLAGKVENYYKDSPHRESTFVIDKEFINTFESKVQNILYGALFGKYSYSLAASRFIPTAVGYGLLWYNNNETEDKSILTAINFLNSEEIYKVIELRDKVTDSIISSNKEYKSVIKLITLVEDEVLNLTGFNNKINQKKLSQDNNEAKDLLCDFLFEKNCTAIN